MKSFSRLFKLAIVSTLCCACCSVFATDETNNPQGMKTVYQFIKDAGHYYIATVDGDQPRVRPFGTIHIFEGKLYIQTGKKKNVARQIAANSKVELCTMKGDRWIRLSGTLVLDDRRVAKESMLNAYPSLKSMYSVDDENTQVFYFKNATAIIDSFKVPRETIRF